MFISKGRNMKPKLFYLVLLLVISINTGCKNSSNPVDGSESLPPAIKDSIPYGSMGAGKIVFERMSPTNSNNSSGGYVLDINKQKNWSFSALLDGPSISPDGKLVAFTKSTSWKTSFDVYTSNIDGSNLTQITAIEDNEYSPSWSPNSDYIYFTNFKLSSYMYQTSLASHNSTLVFSKPEITGPASISSDGRILYSTGRDIIAWQNNSDITIKSNSISGISFFSPCYNPQGDKIAYIEATYGPDSSYNYFRKIKVIKMDSNGSNSVTLAEFAMVATGSWSGSNNISLSWSPDGSKIAFNKPEYENCAHIYIVNSDGTNLVQVTSADGVYDRSVSWGN
jgi:Tol biopolymer transport system component